MKAFGVLVVAKKRSKANERHQRIAAIRYDREMTSGSSIPGPKPPAATVNRETTSASQIDPLDSLIPSPLKDSSQRESDIAANRIDQILNRPTAEILQEASAVASYAIEDSKTVGGLGVNPLAVDALVVASPWSWIYMLLFGPVRVWRFFSGVFCGIGSALGLAIFALLIFIVGVSIFLGWIIL